MVDKVGNAANGNLKGSIISVLGVTFKPNADDMREAPSLIIIPELIKRGAKIRVTDPQGEKEGSKLLKNVECNPLSVARAYRLEHIVCELRADILVLSGTGFW